MGMRNSKGDETPTPNVIVQRQIVPPVLQNEAEELCGAFLPRGTDFNQLILRIRESARLQGQKEILERLLRSSCFQENQASFRLLVVLMTPYPAPPDWNLRTFLESAKINKETLEELMLLQFSSEDRETSEALCQAINNKAVSMELERYIFEDTDRVLPALVRQAGIFAIREKISAHVIRSQQDALMSLPREIREHVFGYLSRPDLAKLLLISTEWRAAAIGHLSGYLAFRKLMKPALGLLAVREDRDFKAKMVDCIGCDVIMEWVEAGTRYRASENVTKMTQFLTKLLVSSFQLLPKNFKVLLPRSIDLLARSMEIGSTSIWTPPLHVLRLLLSNQQLYQLREIYRDDLVRAYKKTVIVPFNPQVPFLPVVEFKRLRKLDHIDFEFLRKFFVDAGAIEALQHLMERYEGATSLTKMIQEVLLLLSES
eukprot:TRINITY_DN4887_c1_g1_i1.p1 TRINITY_DN4887_c1_g1~~TRINITY_DN4887_c1_g1_i1.p1  ORF type:complete len:428 (-),score=64.39 TRINITY_DN4887_c1_g1_i1:75-1358(-)